jgi:hypothetical protein
MAVGSVEKDEIQNKKLDNFELSIGKLAKDDFEESRSSVAPNFGEKRCFFVAASLLHMSPLHHRIEAET